jgi:hypothetical protein
MLAKRTRAHSAPQTALAERTRRCSFWQNEPEKQMPRCRGRPASPLQAWDFLIELAERTRGALPMRDMVLVKTNPTTPFWQNEPENGTPRRRARHVLPPARARSASDLAERTPRLQFWQNEPEKRRDAAAQGAAHPGWLNEPGNSPSWQNEPKKLNAATAGARNASPLRQQGEPRDGNLRLKNKKNTIRPREICGTNLEFHWWGRAPPNPHCAALPPRRAVRLPACRGARRRAHRARRAPR